MDIAVRRCCVPHTSVLHHAEQTYEGRRSLLWTQMETDSVTPFTVQGGTVVQDAVARKSGKADAARPGKKQLLSRGRGGATASREAEYTYHEDPDSHARTQSLAADMQVLGNKEEEAERYRLRLDGFHKGMNMRRGLGEEAAPPGYAGGVYPPAEAGEVPTDLDQVMDQDQHERCWGDEHVVVPGRSGGLAELMCPGPAQSISGDDPSVPGDNLPPASSLTASDAPKFFAEDHPEDEQDLDAFDRCRAPEHHSARGKIGSGLASGHGHDWRRGEGGAGFGSWQRQGGAGATTLTVSPEFVVVGDNWEEDVVEMSSRDRSVAMVDDDMHARTHAAEGVFVKTPAAAARTATDAVDDDDFFVEEAPTFHGRYAPHQTTEDAPHPLVQPAIGFGGDDFFEEAPAQEHSLPNSPLRSKDVDVTAHDRCHVPEHEMREDQDRVEELREKGRLVQYVGEEEEWAVHHLDGDIRCWQGEEHGGASSAVRARRTGEVSSGGAASVNPEVAAYLTRVEVEKGQELGQERGRTAQPGTPSPYVHDRSQLRAHEVGCSWSTQMCVLPQHRGSDDVSDRSQERKPQKVGCWSQMCVLGKGVHIIQPWWCSAQDR